MEESDAEKTDVLTGGLPVHESWLPIEHPLHRPRHSDKQRSALFIAAVFFLVPVLTLAMGARPAEFENHRLAPFPSPLDGWGLLTGLPDWATDHLPFRDAAVRAADDISRSAFGEPVPFDRQQAPEQGPPQVPFSPPSVTPLEPDEREPQTIAGFPNVVEGQDGWLYYGFDFQGKCKPSRSMDEVIGNLKRLRQAVEASGRQFVLAVVPDKSTIVTDKLPRRYSGKDCARPVSDEFWRRVTTEAGAIDLRADLRRLAEEDGTAPYFKLDTHWDDRGAMAMVRRVAEEIQPGVTASWRSEPEHIGSYQADLPKLLGRSGSNEVQMYSLAPDGRRDRTRQAVDSLDEPAQLRSTPGTGMVNTPVGFLVDSFTLPATRYLPAAFSDTDLCNYVRLEDNPGLVLDLLPSQRVVVVEAIERNLASGIAPIVAPEMIDKISQRLAENPIR